MQANITAVTALYYLERDKWEHSGFGKNIDRYKWWLPNILSLNTNLIIFTDDHYYNHIIETKKKFESDSRKLTVIKIPLEQLEMYVKYKDSITQVMNSADFKASIAFDTVAEMLYPLYNVLIYNKVSFVKEAATLDPYNSTHYFWVDVGAFRGNIVEYYNVSWPTKKEYFHDKVVFFSHYGWDYNLDDQKKHFLSQTRVVHGGYFIMPKQLIDAIKELVEGVLVEVLRDGYIGSEEKAFDLICKRHPEYFELVKAGWFEFYNLTK